MTEDLYAFDLAYRSDYPVICGVDGGPRTSLRSGERSGCYSGPFGSH